MSTDALPTEAAALSAQTKESSFTEDFVQPVLETFASLKITVALFAMAIFIVLAGTLAQVNKEIWTVIDEYFRTPFAWIEFQIFFPPSFFPSKPQIPGGFWFPGGWLIGGFLSVNLLCAHLIRFKVNAKGTRLKVGTLVILFGMLVTWLVIMSGSNKSGIQEVTWIEWSTLWNLFKGGLFVLTAGMAYSAIQTERGNSLQRTLLWILAGATGAVTIWLLVQGKTIRPDDSAMRILWQLLKGTAAGLVLLIGCVMVFKKRGGVVLLHGGVALMMFSEVLVGTTAVETQMTMAEGDTVNFAKDIREYELAVVSRADSRQPEVTAVPESRLHDALFGEKTISDPELPFDVKPILWMTNSDLRKIKTGEGNFATKGTGLQWKAEELRGSTGTDTSGGVDRSTGYFQFFDKETGDSLGTYLVSSLFSEQDIPEQVTVDGKTYDVFLRFKRTYKPYSLHLVDVRKDDYPGTSTPMNYSSEVLLVDPSRNVKRDIKIWMNNPLRFAGETFYQSGYFMDPRSGKEVTTLAVVTNTGWMIPYVSCMLVAVGILYHFWLSLTRFLNRRATLAAARLAATESGEVIPQQPVVASTGKWTLAQSVASWLLTAAVLLLMASDVYRAARTPKPDVKKFDFYAAGQLPVIYKGRCKPLDTLARNSLRILSNKQTFKDSNDETQPAIRWLMDVIAKPGDALKHKILRIENLEVLDMLKLEHRKGFLYSYSEIEPQLAELSKQAKQAHDTDPANRELYQRKILELEQKFGLLNLLMQSFSPPHLTTENFREDLMAALRDQQTLQRREPPLSIPPEKEDGEWEMFSTAWTRNMVQAAFAEKDSQEAVSAWSEIIVAYAEDNAAKFNEKVAGYEKFLQQETPPNLNWNKNTFEAYFNHFSPFFHASIWYIVVFVLAALGWLGWSRPLNRAAFWLAVATFALHSYALVARMYISGRPPVTNLYSSAVFIGWGCVLLCLIFELIYRMGIGNIVAGITGFGALLIAHFLSIDGDTFTVLQAVLDTQFWLATHVTCITLGYSTTFLAGIIGALYILRGILTPTLKPAVGKEMTRMIYGTICFAIFFSFVGTVLGGLWADDSWGRFWGWDPKENGALIIVLWNALVLHARWGGMVKERGLAVLAVAGNIATSWSWFGVNELGVGLHSYGFTEGVLFALGIFVISQLLIIAIGCLPDHWWWSHRRNDGDSDERLLQGMSQA